MRERELRPGVSYLISERNGEKDRPEISLEDIVRASERLEPFLRATPLRFSRFFSGESGNEVYLDPENLQETGSFKIRGALNAILLQRAKGVDRVVTASSGNHAQGVAFAASETGISATIVMPAKTPLVKVKATKEYGCEVIIHGDCYDEAEKEASRISEESGSVFIHPFNDLDVIAGQGTIGIEILSEFSSADTILVPIGGGGLIAGIAIAAKAIKPETRIIGVQPDGAAAMYQSIEAGYPVELDDLRTIADGVAVKRVADFTFETVRRLVDTVITVSDDKIREALLSLWGKDGLLCEPSGAVGLAALLSPEFIGKGGNIVAVISGGNIDDATRSKITRR